MQMQYDSTRHLLDETEFESFNSTRKSDLSDFLNITPSIVSYFRWNWKLWTEIPFISDEKQGELDQLLWRSSSAANHEQRSEISSSIFASIVNEIEFNGKLQRDYHEKDWN